MQGIQELPILTFATCFFFFSIYLARIRLSSSKRCLWLWYVSSAILWYVGILVLHVLSPSVMSDFL